MQNVSALYRELMASPNHWFETRLEIGDPGVLVDHIGNRIVFGNTVTQPSKAGRILISESTEGAETGFGDSQLYELSLTRKMFSNGVPAVGCCVSGEIDVRMRRGPSAFPRMARMVPWVRVTDGEQASEWLQKGVYWIDTREYTNNSDNVVVDIHGYDSMLMLEQPFPSTDGIEWPAKDWQIVSRIAAAIGVSVDIRTWDVIPYGSTSRGYDVQIPEIYTMREVLGYIGAMYAGNWVMNDVGNLRLITLNAFPPETSYLVDENGYVITFLDPDEHYPDTAQSSSGGSSSGTGGNDFDPDVGGGNTGGDGDLIFEEDDTGGSSGGGDGNTGFEPFDPDPGFIEDPEVPDEPLIEDNFNLLGSRSVISGNPDKVVRILV